MVPPSDHKCLHLTLQPSALYNFFESEQYGFCGFERCCSHNFTEEQKEIETASFLTKFPRLLGL